MRRGYPQRRLRSPFAGTGSSGGARAWFPTSPGQPERASGPGTPAIFAETSVGWCRRSTPGSRATVASPTGTSHTGDARAASLRRARHWSQFCGSEAWNLAVHRLAPGELSAESFESRQLEKSPRPRRRPSSHLTLLDRSTHQRERVDRARIQQRRLIGCNLHASLSTALPHDVPFSIER